MPTCEVCKKKFKVVYKCKECGIQFCTKCGKKERELCVDCAAYEDDAKGGYKLEQEASMDLD